jgi:hypothetical protein
MGCILWVNLRFLKVRSPNCSSFSISRTKHFSFRNYSKPSDNTNTNEWSTGWNDDDNQSWVSGGGQSDASAITSRAPKTSAGNYYIRVGISFRNSCCNIKTSQQGQNDARAITFLALKKSAGNNVIMSNLK